MKYILASFASIGFIFAWAATVALGGLRVGSSAETVAFAISLIIPGTLLVVGIISETREFLTLHRWMTSGRGR